MKKLFLLVTTFTFLCAQEKEVSLPVKKEPPYVRDYNQDSNFPLGNIIMEDGKDCLYNKTFTGRECCAGCCFSMAVLIGSLEITLWPIRRVAALCKKEEE